MQRKTYGAILHPSPGASLSEKILAGSSQKAQKDEQWLYTLYFESPNHERFRKFVNAEVDCDRQGTESAD